jgi:hypothetical protein
MSYPAIQQNPARDIECERCGARPGERCFDPHGHIGPYHVERARMARWASMFALALLLLCFLPRASAQLIVPVTSECATSVDGTVVGTLNPLNPPQVSAVFSGTLPSGTYYIEIAWYDAASHVTLPSPEVQQQLVSTGELQISPPASGQPATAVGMQVFIGATSGGETLQGTTTGSATFTQSTPLSAGTALPTTNNTVCSVVANDAGWPTGTGYSVSLTTPAGATLPGYPLQAQFLGPGNTINLSQGFPLYNGTVTYPVPVLSRPYGHGPQGIAGPLDLTGYNLTSVNRLGIGTKVPGWGVDAEGTGINGAVNANTGFLFDGTAPLNHVLLGNGSYYVDSATIPASVISGLPTLFYQTVSVNGVAGPQEPALNFSGRFVGTDSAGVKTNIDANTTGSEPKLVSATTNGTNGNCAQWNAVGGIGDAGAPCNSANAVLSTGSQKRILGGDTGACSSTFSVTFTPAFSGTPLSCQATGVGGSVNVATCTASGMTGNCTSVSDVYWLAFGAN